MEKINQSSRRQFIKAGGIFIAGSAVVSAVNAFGKEEEKKNEEVSPPEDLMREHGVLKRILLIYGEALQRMESNEDLPPDPVLDAAKVIREFVEDYHEKLEENFLFPRFKKANRLIDLVDVLLQQHQAGRRLTDITMQLATNQALKNAEDRRKLADSMRQFIRMYNPARSARGHRPVSRFPGNRERPRVRFTRRRFREKRRRTFRRGRILQSCRSRRAN
jgi:hypothetical protein